MRKLLALTACALVFAAGAFAQSSAGMAAISGTVRDASGAAVPDAQVVVANASKGIRRVLTTTDAGVFAAPALVPSAGYSLTVTKSGFANWEARDFAAQVGQTVDFRVNLEVSAATTQVQVTGEAPMVEETKSGVTQTVTQGEIDNLPINGRRADTFALMTPAVVPDGTFGLVSFHGVSSGNSFLTDGNDTTNAFYNENAGRTRITTQISQDAVQEFQVMSNGFSAEFGRAMGGVINTVTRSGTNDLHGTGYWYFRNRTLNATDRYAAGVNGKEWRHQAGGTLSGPVKKDKIFFLLNSEIVKRNFPGLNRIINTQITDTGGKINPALCTATAEQCAAAFAFIGKQMERQIPRSVSSVMGFAKLDFRPNERNSFTVNLNAMHWRSPNGIQTQTVLTNGNMIGSNGSSTVETRYGKASWTFIPSNNAVNELRFGWFKDRLSDPGASDLWPSTGALGISVNSATLGAASSYPRTLPSEQRYQLVDNISWTHGAHSAKFGVDFSSTEDWLNQLSNWAGSYSYSTLTNFAKDFSGNSAGAKNYSSFTQTFGNAIRDERFTDINFYAQDTWKATSHITLNYGVRYEKSFLPQPTLTDPNYPQTAVIPAASKNFAPRVSLSYSLGDRTVIRAGYGIYYARMYGAGVDQLWLGSGKFQTSISVTPTTVNAPVFPLVVPSASLVPAGSVDLTFADKNLRSPYSQQGTFALEHQLARDWAVTATYIWTRGVQLWTRRDLNLADPTASGTYTIMDASGKATGTWTTPLYTKKNDTRYGRIWQAENGGQSWYNGLALQLRKRMSHGLSAQVAYTWSHAIDDAKQSGGSTVVYWQQDGTYNGNYSFDKGSSGIDQRHRVGINFLWNPTFTTSTSTAARYLVNGWQLSAITTMASSVPTSGTVSVSGQQFTAQGISMVQTGSLNGGGLWNRVPFWPVNSLDVDKMYRVDARLSRTLPINERVKGYLMFEAFNAFNTQYNTAINTSAYTASAGVLRPVAGLGVGNTSQGFPDGTNARRMQVALRFTF